MKDSGETPPIIRELVEGNARFVTEHWSRSDRDLAAPPAKRLAIVACMDTRHNVERVLGLEHGDATIVSNAGNLLDDGALRSLLVAVHLLGVHDVVIMGHTRCVMTLVGRGEFRIAKSIAQTAHVPLDEVMNPDFQWWLGGFADPASNVRRGLELVRNHPYMPADLGVHGIIYDDDTGFIHPL